MLIEERDGRLVRIVDRTGHVWANLTWDGDRLERLEVPGACLLGEVITDPLLGPAHAIEHTTISAIDWSRPTEIPTLAAPGKLPPGAGGALLNTLAILAARAHVPALRYAGPYPTSALWRSLGRSFRCEGTEAAFIEDSIERMTLLARDPIPIDFVPAPHDRIAIPHGHVELRAELERVTLDGVPYELDGSPARLVENRCEIWFGDTCWSHVATLDPDGTLLEGPHPIRRCTSDVVGKAFPPALVAAIAELVADAVPVLLGGAARELILARTLRWADLGARAAAVGDELAVHAALWEQVGPLGLGRLALALAEALVPIVTTRVAADVAVLSAAALTGVSVV